MKTHLILLVDDEPQILNALSACLDKLPVNVFKANHASKGLEILQSKDISLAIIDLHMPEVSGIELLKLMQYQNIKTPTLVLTGYGSIPSSVEAMRHGAVDYIEKPISRSDFIKVVEKYLPAQDPWRDSLNAFIDQNFDNESFGLDDVLKHYRCSKSHACKLFKKHLGKSFGDQLRERRLKNAEEFVVHSTLSFSEIASLCGFRSLSGFGRAFKQSFGCTPSAYRKNVYLMNNFRINRYNRYLINDKESSRLVETTGSLGRGVSVE